MLSEEPFELTIPRSYGALTFTYNKPVHVSKVVPHYPGRKVANDNVIDDPEGLIDWLTGGSDGMQSHETDIYGVVALDLDMDVSGALADIAMFSGDDEDAKKTAQKSYEKIQKDLIKNTSTALKRARELADSRVKRAMKRTHSNLLMQYETLKQQGGSPYAPSTSEAIGAFILRLEVDKAAENRKKMFNDFTENMKETFITR